MFILHRPDFAVVKIYGSIAVFRIRIRIQLGHGIRIRIVPGFGNRLDPDPDSAK
jgi:hypothetical protein